MLSGIASCTHVPSVGNVTSVWTGTDVCERQQRASHTLQVGVPRYDVRLEQQPLVRGDAEPQLQPVTLRRELEQPRRASRRQGLPLPCGGKGGGLTAKVMRLAAEVMRV